MSPANLQGWDIRYGEDLGLARGGRLGAGCAVLFSGLPKSQPTSVAVGDLWAGTPKAGGTSSATAGALDGGQTSHGALLPVPPHDLERTPSPPRV